MSGINLGVVIVLITIFGYVSNFLNWRYLNFGIIRSLYYIGAVVHETSHAVLCIVTGAKIQDFTVFSSQPHVVHQKSRLPLIGEPLISFAPIAGGLLFLFLVNRYLLGSHFIFTATWPQFSSWRDWGSVLLVPLGLLRQIDLLQWQSWVMILLFFNVGAMLGPSPPHDPHAARHPFLRATVPIHKPARSYGSYGAQFDSGKYLSPDRGHCDP